MSRSRLYFLSLCTEGFPHDEGYDITKSAHEIKKYLSPYFEEIFIYTPRTLKEIPGSENFCNPQEGEFPLNPGLNKLGCGDFKSFLIDYTLSNIPENSVLIYHDCNFEKYVQYWQTDWRNLSEICNFFIDNNGGNLFIPFESSSDAGIVSKVKLHGKRFTTKVIVPDDTERALVEDCHELASSRMIIRNTPVSRQFFKDYKDLCEDKDLLKKWPNPNPHPEYTHSCPEQHIMNCLAYKYVLDGKLPPDFPKYQLNNRRLRLDPYLRVIYNDDLIRYVQNSKLKEIAKNLKHDYNI
jgi:hypothetical protein